MARLTIAIPTYNRPEKLLNTVKLLLPQLTDEVCILILDNFSDVIIKDYLHEYIEPAYTRFLDIRRNFINIGPDANFMRCFEYCTTTFIWTLSDDQHIMPDAVMCILNEINQYGSDNIIGFNMGSNYTSRLESIEVESIESLLTHIENFENLLLLSTNVYKRNEYVKFIRYGYWGAYSMASQNIPCLLALAAGKKLILSKYKIVNNLDVLRADKWPDAQQALALSSILEIPFKFANLTYKELGKFLMRNIETFPRIYCDIILAVNFDVKKIDSYHRYIYKKIYNNTFSFRQNKVKQFLLYRFYYFLLLAKPLSALIIKNPVMRRYILSSSRFELFER